MLLYLPALKLLTFFGNNVRGYGTVNILLVELHNSSHYVHIHTVIPLLEWLNLTLALLKDSVMGMRLIEAETQSVLYDWDWSSCSFTLLWKGHV